MKDFPILLMNLSFYHYRKNEFLPSNSLYSKMQLPPLQVDMPTVLS